MEKKEKHNQDYQTPDQIAKSMPAEGKNRKRNNTVKTNKLWIWLGVLVLIFILIYWLFIVGTWEDILGYFNG